MAEIRIKIPDRHIAEVEEAFAFIRIPAEGFTPRQWVIKCVKAHIKAVVEQVKREKAASVSSDIFD